MNASQLPPAERAFAEALAPARRRAGLSQEKLATLMADAGYVYSQNTVWRIENGRRPLRLGEAAALARITGITPAEFLAVCGLQPAA